MKAIELAAIVVLSQAICMSALAQGSNQPAQQFFNFVCEIDAAPVSSSYRTPDGNTSIDTFDSHRLCTGEASARNIKLECSGTLPGWNQGSLSATGFPCTINGDRCGIEPQPGDPNAPFLTATQSSLSVSASGAASLVCFYKP